MNAIDSQLTELNIHNILLRPFSLTISFTFVINLKFSSLLLFCLQFHKDARDIENLSLRQSDLDSRIYQYYVLSVSDDGALIV